MKKETVISSQQREATDMCLKFNLPFALFAPPGEEMRFIASVPSEDECRNEWEAANSQWNGFIINFFANDEEYVAGVRDVFDEQSVVSFINSNREFFPSSVIEAPAAESTPRLKYLATATSIISRLKRDGGKTVFSRVIVSESARPLLDVAEDYFSRFPNTFRYLCFTQETGVWFGATPETLAYYSRASHEISTMALAGTIPVEQEQWDAKNIAEQAYVRNYIVDTLRASGATDIIEGETFDLPFGNVKHRCTPISAVVNVDSLRGMLYALSPTPAVAGTPRQNAIEEIFISEGHSRLCYAGFVGIKDDESLRAWANLRCATVRRNNPDKPDILTYYVFAGGGLTAKSIPEDEWTEGENKTLYIRQAINPEVIN